MLLIVVLWFGISAPLSLVGSYFGSKHGVRFCFLSYTRFSWIRQRPYATRFESTRYPGKFLRFLGTCNHG